MEKQFWLDRWQQGLTGFHLKEVNEHLEKWFRYIELEPGNTVFVPMCGKTLDMIWLANQGYQVIAVELSRLAVYQFIEENNLSYKKSEVDNFTLYSMKNIKIYCGDYFNLMPAHVESVDLIYDRASLIALPPEMREQYVKHLSEIFTQSTPGLLITLDYKQTEMQGPPFAVCEDDVRRYYNQVRFLQSFDVLAGNQRFVDKGATRLDETIWLVSTLGAKT